MDKEATVKDRTKRPIHCMGLLSANQNQMHLLSTFNKKVIGWGEILCMFLSCLSTLKTPAYCRKYATAPPGVTLFGGSQNGDKPFTLLLLLSHSSKATLTQIISQTQIVF